MPRVKKLRQIKNFVWGNLMKFSCLIKEILRIVIVMKKSYRVVIFLLLAMGASFCITCDFAIVKPASSSIFISQYGASKIPYAWLLAIPINLLIVNAYNWLLPRIGCIPLLVAISGAVVGMNIFTGLNAQSSWVPFVHYVVKDIYVLLMFQQVWSVIHVTLNMKEAKYLYGIIFGIGGLGAMLGSYVTKGWAVQVGSEHLLFASAPIYLSFILIYFLLLKASTWCTGSNHFSFSQERKERGGGFQKIYSSRYLQYILCIVVAMQLTATVVEYQFNSYLEKAYPVQDVRTAFTGMLFGYVNMATVLFQFIGTSLFIHFFGVLRSHIFIPCGFALFAFANIMIPTFSMTSITFGVIKSFDYSFFRILTEMLYIPLNVEEKFHAKAVIDVFAYRSARGIASALILFLQIVSPFGIEPVLRAGAFVVLLLWLFATFGIARIYPTLQKQPA